MSKVYNFGEGLVELTRGLFCMKKKEDKKKDVERSIGDLIELLGAEIGVEQAAFVYYQFGNRYMAVHKVPDRDNVDELVKYNKEKAQHWKNYVKAYYGLPRSNSPGESEEEIDEHYRW